ncbi:TolC family protein [Chitinophagaceae bacterium LB-8]|uniref:TolC family protein n=1 Tax=Paraflavisolibacter caeni TaxID=2982496 RepID=A0A9X2XYQ5_9BACT|nr:TolC family protein [Paraflavisolibacter caeni]MCU7551260.1 TolC family protein [Paraflavisolibacter caeni]
MIRSRMNIKFLYLLTTALLFAFAGNAQTNTLSLKQSLEFALQNHPSLDIFKNEQVIADYKAKEALASYLPQVNANLAADDNLKLQTTVIPAGVFGPSETKVSFGNKYTTVATLQAEQTIFDQSMLLGIKAAKPNTQLADLNKEKNDEIIIYNAATAYYQVMIYKEQEKLLAENEKKYQELLPTLKLQYEKGVAKKIDYDRVRVNLLNIQSQKQVVQTNYQVALNQLKNAIGMPLNAPLTITDSVNISTALQPLANQDFSPSNKLDYKIQQQNIELYNIDVKRKKASYLPTVSMYYRYGQQAFGGTISKTYGNWYDFSGVGLKVNVPIFSGMRRNSQLKQSQLSLENAMNNLKISETNLTMQYQNAQTKLLSSYTNAQTNKENLSLAQDVFTTTSLQYQKGTTSLTELLNADYSYKEAQNNYITSVINYYVANIELERAKGTLKTFINTL